MTGVMARIIVTLILGVKTQDVIHPGR